MFLPIYLYPLYENASHAAWGQTPREAMAESALLWSRYSEVAATNPYAWLKKTYSPAQIGEATADNRLIAWPYTKHMVANPLVNMGAAVLMTSLGVARELGIPEERLVYVWGGAQASEPRDILARDQYARSHAQDLVMETILAQAGGDASAFSMLELYSCFPVVPKMARRTLGLAADARMTSTGGLSFFGAPLNNYMTHAAAGLVRALREDRGKLALLYGQGEFVTKHHALVLASKPPAPDALREDYSVQTAADARRAAVPPVVAEHNGAATLETFTVVYERDGTPNRGVVIGRTPGGARLMARVDAAETATLAQLTALDRSPVGSRGEVAKGQDGLLRWKAMA
jgi:acetyl-CoA C-acetyltransferase